MRFEKLNENKIRITLSHQDLVEKDIDFHSFMSNSLDSQDLFFDMLNEAEKEIGFITKDYKIRIEALAMAGGDFILTVTRSLPETGKTTFKKKVQIKRKKPDYESSQAVYMFSSFDDFSYFIDFLKNSKIDIFKISKSIILYEYKNTYYLVLNKINLNLIYIKNFFSCITEFANLVNNSNLFICKLNENGNIILKNSSFKNYINSL